MPNATVGGFVQILAAQANVMILLRPSKLEHETKTTGDGKMQTKGLFSTFIVSPFMAVNGFDFFS
jgi:hypothetical protein